VDVHSCCLRAWDQFNSEDMMSMTRGRASSDAWAFKNANLELAVEI